MTLRRTKLEINERCVNQISTLLEKLAARVAENESPTAKAIRDGARERHTLEAEGIVAGEQVVKSEILIFMTLELRGKRNLRLQVTEGHLPARQHSSVTCESAEKLPK